MPLAEIFKIWDKFWFSPSSPLPVACYRILFGMICFLTFVFLIPDLYIWLGSHGLVHKGLDLVLEAFAQAPELKLTVCGPVSAEPDFVAEYRRELALPNVRVHDWIDTQSPLFRELLATHSSIIYPSCSEGGGGSVITCLHGGLIPIVTREASVDVENFGFPLREAGVAAIVEAVRHVAGLPAAELSLRSRAAWEFARRQHTREAFEKNYRLFVRDVLGFPLVA